jgi:hypothetical protein
MIMTRSMATSSSAASCERTLHEKFAAGSGRSPRAPQSLYDRGYAVSREQAMADFKARLSALA